MVSPSRSRRSADEFDDFDDDDFDGGGSRQAGQEKMKLLVSDLFGRWHWVALGLILGVLGGFYYLSKAPQIYQARSTLLIKQQTSSVISRDQVDELDMRSLEGLNTLAERITRPELMQKVAARPDVRGLPGLMPPETQWLPDWALPWFGKSKEDKEKSLGVPPPASLAGAIANWTEISVRRGTRLLDVFVSHPSPEVAKTVADAIVVEYQAELTGARSSGRDSSLQILINESEAARNRLQTSQNALASYQRALVTLKELESRETIAGELARRYLPKHPKMIAAQAELVAFQKQFLAEFDSARTSTADRDYWEKHSAEWSSAKDDDDRLQNARRLLLARGSVLESEIASQNSVFNTILTRIHEADINQQAVESEMEIDSHAQLPRLPVSPKNSRVLAMATIGGLAFGVLLALFFIRLDNKIHTVSQAERETGLPVLAAISEIPARAVGSSARNKKTEGTKVPAARQGWSPLLMFQEGSSSTTFAEMFRVLRASVSLLGDEKKRRTTLFSSALPGEGKTFIAGNFALAAAHQGKRTLLIDLDLRKPAMHKLFGMKRDSHPQGVTEVLSGQASFQDAIFKDTGADHLHLMLSGRRAPNPGELLNASSLEEFLATAVAAYDVVVIDSAPLLAVPDTRIIAGLADNFCLVVRGNFVPKGAARRVIEMLRHDHNTPSGIVFNGFSEKRRLMGQNYTYGNYQTSRFGKQYRYGYGSYGSYGSDQED